MQPIVLEGISFSYPAVRVLSDVALALSPGERSGLIGENGSGKSTLLKLVAGENLPDVGTLTVPESMGYLAQEVSAEPGISVTAFLELATKPIRDLETILEETATKIALDPENSELVERYDKALSEAEIRQLWTLEARQDQALSALGLADLDRTKALGELSGGQQRRLALAAILIGRPDSLVLDEPTNHLDRDGIEFLVAELSNWRGPVLFASHDRWFLDKVATNIIDLEPQPMPDGTTKQGMTWGGNFSDYLVAQAEARQRWKQQRDKQDTERKRLEQEISTGARQVFHRDTAPVEIRAARKFYADRAAKTVGGRVASARRSLTNLERNLLPVPPKQLQLRSKPQTQTKPGRLVSLVDVAVSGRLDPVTLDISTNQRLLVTGPNGSGKSTLLAILAGHLAPESGSIEERSGLRVGLLDQQGDWPNLDESVNQAYRSRLTNPGDAPSLGQLGLFAGDQNQPLRQLSVGQQRRIALAALLAEPPDLLLLDEPTNHLSLRLNTELEEALASYQGAVVIASHDRWLLERYPKHKIELHAPPSLR